ncbi:hypothetical protein ACLB2K_024910 [Fragaria x ananassa]
MGMEIPNSPPYRCQREKLTRIELSFEELVSFGGDERAPGVEQDILLRRKRQESDNWRVGIGGEEGNMDRNIASFEERCLRMRMSRTNKPSRKTGGDGDKNEPAITAKSDRPFQACS